MAKFKETWLQQESCQLKQLIMKLFDEGNPLRNVTKDVGSS